MKWVEPLRWLGRLLGIVSRSSVGSLRSLKGSLGDSARSQAPKLARGAPDNVFDCYESSGFWRETAATSLPPWRDTVLSELPPPPGAARLVFQRSSKPHALRPCPSTTIIRPQPQRSRLSKHDEHRHQFRARQEDSAATPRLSDDPHELAE
jgi:hypothetical protein